MTRLVLVATALFATLTFGQPNQTLLTVPSIPGSGNAGRIPVSGWSFISAPGTTGTIKVSSLAITQADDESAPLLLKAYAKSAVLGDIVLERFDASGNRVNRLTLARATVTSMSTPSCQPRRLHIASTMGRENPVSNATLTPRARRRRNVSEAPWISRTEGAPR